MKLSIILFNDKATTSISIYELNFFYIENFIYKNFFAFRMSIVLTNILYNNFLKIKFISKRKYNKTTKKKKNKTFVVVCVEC